MGRRRNSNRHSQGSLSDSIDEFENETLASVKPSPRVVHTTPSSSNLSLYEDRRRWAPRDIPREATGRPARTIQKVATPKVIRGPGGTLLKSRRVYNPTAKLREHPGFARAHNVIICLKRQVRKQVLFAKNKTKKGAGSPKRRNQWSDVRC